MRSKTTHHILPAIADGQHLPRLCGGQLKIRNYGDRLDLGGPAKTTEMADVEGRLRRLQTGIDAASGRGQHLGEGDLLAGHVDGIELVEIGANEAPVQGGGDIVRVSLNHQAVVQQAGFGEGEVRRGGLEGLAVGRGRGGEGEVAQQDASHDGGAGGAQAAAEGDGVVNVDDGCVGEGVVAVAAEKVECGAGEEVGGWIQLDGAGGDAGVGDGAVERGM
jgi:hypothetical protein